MVELEDSTPQKRNLQIGTTLTWLNPSHSLKVYFIKAGWEDTEKAVEHR
jgi:hypothetical protein